MEKINFETWPRREIFEFFGGSERPYYELSFPVDVTDFKAYTKKKGISFYFALCYQCTDILSGIDAFLYKIRPDGIIRHERLHSGCTDATPGSDFFHITMHRADGPMEDYCREIHALSRTQKTFINENPVDEDQLVYYTCLPWLPFTSLTNVQPDGNTDSIPRVTFGKYTEKDGRLMMPCSVLVNHRLIDGSAVGEFYEKLQQRMDSFRDLL